MTEMVFTAEEVKNLNEFQRSGAMHSFTCGAEKHDYEPGHRPDLLATTGGWVCPDPHCDYTQDWAHDFMKDGSAVRAAAAMWDQIFAGGHQ